jgi:UPF0716 protein FxsA
VTVPIILFILFVGVPILEIAAFIKIGGWIGLVPTLLGCVVTAVIGAFLVRLQGFGVLRRAQEALARNELPVGEIAHGAFILVAGVLLMTPGYVTDAMGFLLLVPPVRVAIAQAVMTYLKDHATVSVVRAASWGRETRNSGGGMTIEGEAVEIDEKDDRT